ncbi:SRPBCC family protein [Terriglobus sp. TAA 43]|uniref:SRPBCC family protein n=1 Tax=Terriglobus sp. TAA 43 TaxID=278961 RepID=UPI000646C289|nr:SRPBCC family protein [Terriglobus sp. TAA 43]
MATAKATIDLKVPADEVWALIGGFDSLPDWLPYIPNSKVTDGGRVRHLNNPNGQTIVERLENYDLHARTYSYSIVQAPFPVTGYLATITVTPNDGDKGSRVEWSGHFTPKGVTDEEAHKLFQGIFSDGLKALASHYSAKQ